MRLCCIREIWIRIKEARTMHISMDNMAVGCKVEAVIVFILSPVLSLHTGLC